MSDGLRDLLSKMRQHPSFKELLACIEPPQIKPFKLGQAAESQRQEAEWIFASGRVRQDEMWRAFLIEGNPARGNQPSDKEKL